MANNIHFEARRRQMFLDRACQARKDRALAEETQPPPPVEHHGKPETIMCTDQGQFYQTRVNKGRNDVVFEKVIHDPNFYFRASTEQGLQPPLHVNDIYNVMYPGAAVEAHSSKKK